MSGRARLAPGVEYIKAGCPQCGWKDEGFGKRQVARVYRDAQKHADRKGHPVKVEHTHPTLLSWQD